MLATLPAGGNAPRLPITGPMASRLARYYFPHATKADIPRIASWLVLERMRRRMESRFAPLIGKVLRKTGKAAAKLYAETHSYQYVHQLIEHNLTHDMRTVLQHTLAQTADNCGNLVKLFTRVQKAEEDLVKPSELPGMIVWMQSIAARDIVNITASTQEIIAEIIDNALRTGISIDEVAKQIREATPFNQMRADRIARTEVISASNASMFETAKVYYPVNLLTKDWLHTHDNRTRPDHVTAGETQKKVEFTKPFIVGGEEAMFPGDPELSAKQRVNCFPGDTLVEYADVQHITRRWYSGPVVLVKTAFGDELTGTANHPVLTLGGWVPLHALNVGDKVVRSAFSQNMLARNPNIKRNVAKLSEVYDSLLASGILSRVSSYSVNFHGELSDTDVNVIAVNRFLRNSLQPTRSKPRLQQPFTCTHILQRLFSCMGSKCDTKGRLLAAAQRCVSCARKLLPLFQGKILHAQLIPFAYGAPFDTSITQYSQHMLMDQSELLRQSLQRSTFAIEPTDIDIPSRTLGASSVPSAFSSIVSVERRHFSGFVYNLHTKSGYYSANAVVVHNCRCSFTVGVPLPTF